MIFKGELLRKMLKKQWYAILDSKEVKNKPVGVTRLNEKLVLWRDSQNQIHCIFDKCCHRGASLSLGKVVDDHLECPFHGFQYDSSGKVCLIPANGKKASIASRYQVNAFKVVDKYGLIWLYNGEFKEAKIEEIPFFTSLKTGFYYAGFSEVWDVHYSRAIENQLDVVHLPFVHKTTIGKGNKTLVNGPVVKWKDNLMSIYVNNQVDDGKALALKTKDITNYQDFFLLQFQVPNLWQNYITDKLRVFAAFAPIDETHTKIYLRFYQKFLPIPILGDLIVQIGSRYNKIVLHQDRKVVHTQIPKKSSLQMTEKLIPGDLPIIEFRKKMQMLAKENN